MHARVQRTEGRCVLRDLREPRAMSEHRLRVYSSERLGALSMCLETEHERLDGWRIHRREGVAEFASLESDTGVQWIVDQHPALSFDSLVAMGETASRHIGSSPAVVSVREPPVARAFTTARRAHLPLPGHTSRLEIEEPRTRRVVRGCQGGDFRCCRDAQYLAYLRGMIVDLAR